MHYSGGAEPVVTGNARACHVACGAGAAPSAGMPELGRSAKAASAVSELYSCG